MGELYWAIVSLALGGCIGSFLNVVAYRWPRDLSILHPSRSFCPHCRYQIRWYDNIPVVSWLLLRGQCRSCRAPISLQYPLVELATALLFLLTYDAFFVSRQRFGITSLSADWPILLGHFAMWAGMVVVTVMDLEAYMVDIRVTWIVSICGLIAHLAWTPASSADWIRPAGGGAALCFGAAAGLIIGAALFLRKAPSIPEEPNSEVTQEAQSTIAPPPVRTGPRLLGVLLPSLLVIGYLVAIGSAPHSDRMPVVQRLGEIEGEVLAPQFIPFTQDPGAMLLGLGFLLTYLLVTLTASHPQEVADVEIVEAIQSEAMHARRQALWELKLLTPAILLGVGGLLWAGSPGGEAIVARILGWQPITGWWPIYGLSTALFGWVIGGAVGWLCRVIFTLLFGKEAMGMGDVHILAAAGAVAGWPVAFLGFFCAAPLTLLALVVIHFRRQSRAVPYGPWLALGFLLASLYQDRILSYLGVRWLLSSPWVMP